MNAQNIRHGLALPGATTSLCEKAGLCFTASDSGICALWDLRKTACPIFVTRDSGPGNMCLAVDGSGARFVTGGQDSVVRAYSVEKRACLGSQTYHRSPVTAVRIMVSERALSEHIFAPSIECVQRFFCWTGWNAGPCSVLRQSRWIAQLLFYVSRARHCRCLI